MVNTEQLKQDVEYLAGKLPHRGANTDNERLAAEYLQSRFAAHTPQAEIEDFHSIDTYAYLFAAYYVEFVIVALLATWFPWIGLAYGSVIFVMYLAEFTGYSVMGRFLPQYETQNVMARFMSRDPKRLLIVTSHYDSPKATALTHPSRARWLRWAHLGVVFCMLTIIVSCAAAGMGVLEGSEYRADIWLRWVSVAMLMSAALVLYVGESQAEFVSGAVNNASGVAALLQLAESLKEEPPDTTDVWLVATGSKETWLNGMRRLMLGLNLDKERTYFLNIAHVGAGDLRYVTGEGMMHVFPSSKELLKEARELAPEFDATPIKYRGFPTDALIPLTRGYKAMTIMATDAHGLPAHWNWHSDAVSEIQMDVLSRAAAYAEAIVRRVDAYDG